MLSKSGFFRVTLKGLDMSIWTKILLSVLSIFILSGCVSDETIYEPAVVGDRLSFTVDYGDERVVSLYNLNNELVEVDYAKGTLRYDLNAYGEVIGTSFEDDTGLYYNPVEFIYNSAGKVVEASIYDAGYIVRDFFTYNIYGEAIVVERQYGDFSNAYYFNYDDIGQVVSREYDEDNDGYIEEVLYYVYNDFGKVSEIRYDSNNIGYIDRVKYFIYDDYGRLIQLQDDYNNDTFLDVYDLGDDSYETYVYENYSEVTLIVNTSEYESNVFMRYDGDIADQAYEFALAKELFFLDIEQYKFFFFVEEY